MKKWDRKRWSQFMEHQGFYVVVALCIGTLIGTALITQRTSEPKIEIMQATTDAPNPIQAQSDLGERLAPSQSAQVTEPVVTQKTAAPKPKASLDQAKPTPTATLGHPLNWPLLGEVIQPFSMEALIYSETLEEWTTHPGMDIAADEGSPVCAAAEGTITDARLEPLWGNVVTLEHADGWKTRYAGLSTLALVRIGDPVQQGQTIGYVGGTAALEVLMPSHLHFECFLQGKSMDPKPYLPSQSHN